MIWFIFILITAFFALYTILPFFDRNYRSKRLVIGSGEYENLVLRKEEVLAALTDLEYDFRLRKIGEPDFLQMKEKLSLEAIDLMKRIDELAEPQTKKDESSKSVNANKAKVQS